MIEKNKTWFRTGELGLEGLNVCDIEVISIANVCARILPARWKRHYAILYRTE